MKKIWIGIFSVVGLIAINSAFSDDFTPKAPISLNCKETKSPDKIIEARIQSFELEISGGEFKLFSIRMHPSYFKRVDGDIAIGAKIVRTGYDVVGEKVDAERMKRVRNSHEKNERLRVAMGAQMLRATFTPYPYKDSAKQDGSPSVRFKYSPEQTGDDLVDVLFNYEDAYFFVPKELISTGKTNQDLTFIAITHGPQSQSFQCN
ncbi:hypothetical protein K2X30_14660 [bacterium]|jgi:hypothetical protein|nr:hypothetical protein [bacterium]